MWGRLIIQIAVLHARGDARRHQEKRGAVGHAKVVAWDATVFHLVPTATPMHAHVMHASKPMGTSSSAPEQFPMLVRTIHKTQKEMDINSKFIWMHAVLQFYCEKNKTQSYIYIYMLWDFEWRWPDMPMTPAHWSVH